MRSLLTTRTLVVTFVTIVGLLAWYSSTGNTRIQDVSVRHNNNARGRVASNKRGTWMWVPGGKYVGEVVVVLGGNDASHVSRLLAEGFVVWTRNIGSTEEGEFSQEEWDITVKRKLDMDEAWGYLGYLSDPDPRKPTGEYTAFIGSSQDTEPSITSLIAAITCSRITRSIAPVNRRWKITPNPAHYDLINKVSTTMFSKPYPKDATLWGPEFVVPSAMIATHDHQFYRNMEETIPWTGNVNIMKYLWPAVFNLPVNQQTARGVPQCDDPLFREVAETKATQWNVGGTLPDPEGYVEWNAMGVWLWPININVHDNDVPLVIIGGTRHDPTRELLKWGYKVWKRNLDCQRYLRSIWGVDETNEAFHICTESWSYLGYLSDADPARPESDWTVFHHGHLQSWHQPGDMKLVLKDALECAKNRPRRLTPITKVDTMSVWKGWEGTGKAARWIQTWNKAFGEIRKIEGDRLQAWCCASFVLHKSLIARHGHETYHKFLRQKIEGFSGKNKDATGYFFEYTFHLIFGEPEIVDISGIPECPNFTYARDIATGKSPALLEAEREWKNAGRPDPRPSRVHG
eukprot:TRINITY_DN1056_c0_g1_i1.p1 TRINITY_DN1056_c0_g1~~TRINITY_DN1056_c0_g1_i1.p1  ORF type:complete len:573 (+),score=30.67 TRINITY_DN1056_c0_g1_i1:88-1806(+)